MPEDFTNTLNLPKTNFAMRANLPQREPEIYKYWEEIDLYGSLQQHNAEKPLFVMHDGPPYANGDIHIGHALNKILKDFIVRMKNMTGYRMAYIHGWDTHGLPIENQMIKKHKVHPSEMDPLSFRALCAEFARENVQRQMVQIKRLGSIGDWENSYMTILPRFEAKQVKIFGAMAENGYIYKGMKPVYWCPHDETALAEAEIEYAEDPCESIYVKFALTDDQGKIYPHVGGKKVYVVIWTTTTWTLPGNVAICVGPEFEYSVVKDATRGECYIVATELVEQVCQKAGIENPQTLYKLRGGELEGMVCRHPFFDRPSYLIVGDHVTLDSGTGCVHTAPGHGVEDFDVARNYPFLETFVPVDDKGRMNELAGKFQGLTTEAANGAILADLRESGALLATEKIVHTYPHCWRCKHPVLFRATEQWFCSVEGFKDAALKAVSEVRWMPAWGEVRIGNMVRERKDWCISRQRNWGVPIPILYCERCGEHLINKDTIDRISALFEKEGSDAWYKYSAAEILGNLAVCPKCGHTEFRKETDIMDVWFDSGSSYAYVLDEMEGHTFPCDLYLEGNDQYRGWFQSSLLTSVATRGCAPYKAVLTHGFVVDGEGRKMSKSLGNGVDPLDVIKEYGADVLRLWVASVDYTADARISKDILKQLSEIYRKIRNTARILLGNLGDPETDFNPNTDMLPEEALYDIDKWALARLYRLVNRVREAYDSYEFHNILYDVHNFCAIDMSKLYIDITKDRLYVEARDSKARRSAQSAMYRILRALTLLVAPILAYTAEEIWQSLSHLDSDNPKSVSFNEMPEKGDHPALFAVEEKYNRLFDLREDVNRALEAARTDKLIGKSLDAKVTIYTNDEEIYKTLTEFGDKVLSTVFIVSQTEVVRAEIPAGVFSDTVFGIGVDVRAAAGERCDRCWVYAPEGEKTGDGFICSRCLKILKELGVR